MKAIDVIRLAMQWTDMGIAEIVKDMRDAPMTRPTSNGGNHPLWILGHLAVIEGSIPAVLFGERSEVEHWQAMFGPGTEPHDDASRYPSFDEVLSTLRRLRARNLELLEEIGDAGLDRASKAPPPGFEEHMSTFGRAFLLLTLHEMVHYGQIADARRVAGRKPLF